MSACSGLCDTGYRTLMTASPSEAKTWLSVPRRRAVTLQQIAKEAPKAHAEMPELTLDSSKMRLLVQAT